MHIIGNLSSELKRLAKLYTIEEVKKKEFGFWK